MTTTSRPPTDKNVGTLGATHQGESICGGLGTATSLAWPEHLWHGGNMGAWWSSMVNMTSGPISCSMCPLVWQSLLRHLSRLYWHEVAGTGW